MVRISFTPGAAVAMKSNVRATGPIRPSSGILSWSRRYSFSEASVSMDIAHRLGCSSRASKAVSPAS